MPVNQTFVLLILHARNITTKAARPIAGCNQDT